MSSPVGWGGPGDRDGAGPAEGDMDAMRQVSGRGPSSRHRLPTCLCLQGEEGASLSLAHPRPSDTRSASGHTSSYTISLVLGPKCSSVPVTSHLQPGWVSAGGGADAAVSAVSGP